MSIKEFLKAFLDPFQLDNKKEEEATIRKKLKEALYKLYREGKIVAEVYDMLIELIDKEED